MVIAKGTIIQMNNSATAGVSDSRPTRCVSLVIAGYPRASTAPAHLM
jgi:hypothetical protein